MVFEENYGTIRRWLGLKTEAKEPTEMSPLRAGILFSAFTVLGGVLYSLLDPTFGFDLNEFAANALDALWERAHAAHLAWEAAGRT